MRSSCRGAKLLLALCALLSGAAISPAHAQYEVAQIPFFDAPPGTAGLGGGIRLGQDLYFAVDNEDQRQFDLVPLYLYNGKFIFARGTSGGLHLLRNDHVQLNLLLRYRFQKLDPDRNEFYEGIDERRQTLDGGVELRLQGGWGQLNLNYLTDTLDRHNGESAEIAYHYNFDRGSLSFSPFLGWAWNSDKLTNYYFGVSEEEARPDRPAYTPGEAQWFNFGLNTSWQATSRVTFFANVGFGSVDTAIAESPLVEEDGSSAFFAGGTFSFGNVREPTRYITPSRAKEWSWKVNYGYQAEGNIVSEIDQGEFKKSTVADTNIAGLTFAKLLSDGPRADFNGKFAVFRHLEEDEGNGNFFSYSAYITVTGKGFSQWSREEIFRYTFGFGMSYAETVPIAEQRKQAANGNNTSRFLNYLELQLDFPLRRLFKKSKSLRNCYAGVTVVHRSGIFGTSDILGDVAGGADWITAHLECTRGVKS